MPWRTLLLAVAAPLLAFAAWRDAAIGYWLAVGAQRAPWPIQADPRIASAAIDAATLDDIGQLDTFWRAVPATARAALRSEPLDAVAVRQLGSAAAALDQPAALAHVALAERISRRDGPAQAILLRQAAQRNDYPGTFMRLDTLLTTSPAAGRQLFVPLTTLLGDPRVRHGLAAYGYRPWFGTFVAAAVGEAERPADLAALLLQNRAPASQPALTALPRLLTRLLDDGDYATARDLAVRFGRASPKVLNDFAMGPASTDARFAPLTWRLAEADAVQAALMPGGALEVRLRPGIVTAFAERVTAYPPGAYAIEQRAGRGEGDGALLVSWELHCRRGGGPERVWRQSLPMARESARYRLPLRVPPDCPLQYWRLTGLADDTQAEASFTLSGLRIVRS